MRVAPSPAPPDALLLTVDQAASALSVSARTVEHLLGRGQLASLRIGRARRIPRAAVADFIARTVAEQAFGDVEQSPPEAARFAMVGRGH